eukprot:1664386-Pyramimonas_sp.AAC.1
MAAHLTGQLDSSAPRGLSAPRGPSHAGPFDGGPPGDLAPVSQMVLERHSRSQTHGYHIHGRATERRTAAGILRCTFWNSIHL